MTEIIIIINYVYVGKIKMSELQIFQIKKKPTQKKKSKMDLFYKENKVFKLLLKIG
jgi:hypothetical protein